MKKFKKGDKVKLVKGGIIGYETMPWWKEDGLKIGDECIISRVNYFGDIELIDCTYAHHPDHFELVDEHEYIVKLNQSEIDALIDLCGLIHGDGDTMRKHTGRIWDTLYEDLELHSTDPFLTETQSSFRFLK
jgi:hypothetical protein